MPIVTINIADRGNPTKDTPSKVGHMWYSLDDGKGGQPESYGFSPDESHGEKSKPFAPGKVNTHGSDNDYYQGTYYYSRKVEISQAQYDAMKGFGEKTAGAAPDSTVTAKDINGKDQSFTLHYNGLSNSCIDYTWKAMEVGGLNPDGFEGDMWPTNNKDDVESALDKFEKSPLGLMAKAGGAAGTPGAGGILQVCMGASMMCTFGLAPSTLVVLPLNRVFTNMVPDANIMDHIPLVNILPFGMCTSLANPTVAAATSAAMGVLTPMPCIPATPAPWAPGAATVILGNMPSLDNISTLNCIWGGVISFVTAGEFTVNIP
jgi:hypothetical protein